MIRSVQSSSKELPSTNDRANMRMAIAWSIVNSVSDDIVSGGYSDGDSKRQKLTEAYIKTYNALLANERGETAEGDS